MSPSRPIDCADDRHLDVEKLSQQMPTLPGGSLRWGFLPHGELPEAFYDVGSAVMITTRLS
jgi:hypothetical protein